MMSSQPERSRWVVAFFILIGILLIAASVHVDNTFWKELLKELGIVVLAVFVISWLYEIAVAEKYFAEFSKRLREIIETGESLTASCRQLGIIGVYASRVEFEKDFRLTEMLHDLKGAGSLCISARTMYNIVNRPEVFQRALERGFRLQLCVYDPIATDQSVYDLSDTNDSDVRSAMRTLSDRIVPWLNEKMPQGTIEIRVHPHLIFDSYLLLEAGGKGWAILDLSFGRDLRDKRIIVVDIKKPLGLDLRKRFDALFIKATTVFEYTEKAVKLDKLLDQET